MISFDGFFRALYGADPYPWQQRLAARCADGEPPATIAVPTGSGKTATIDALVWALATQAAERGRASRTLGVRIVWAIDRRILVDQVHERAEEIARRLQAALADERDALHTTAAALSSLTDGGPPLLVTRWRGGIDPDREIPSPLQPQVITSTVAQIASRLLFRGYGVSAATRTVAAGLAAYDTTLCIDEAHLAAPLCDTVGQIVELQVETIGVPGLRAITLTATPGAGDEEPLVLGDDDRADPRLARRLGAPKTATLHPLPGANDAARASALVEATLQALDGGAETVACVVNTVRQARDVHRALTVKLGRGDAAPYCGLLVGPQRPVDRTDALDHLRRLFDRATGGRPVVCVATQTFEVGLDADVDALVTESASASALIQRLGRLNRSGAAPGGGHATIVRDEGSWLYGDEESAAWEWLTSLPAVDGEIDVSVAALERSERKPRSPSEVAPALTAEIVGHLVHTAADVGPWQEIDVEVFWRGALARPGADVAVCWRADLRPEHVSAAGDGYRELLLSAARPQREEQLTVSVSAARALLAARHPAGGAANAVKAAVSDADVEGEEEGRTATPAYDPAVNTVPFVVVRGNDVLPGTLGDRDGAVRPREIRPGDLLVLPAGTVVDPPVRADDRAGDVFRPDQQQEWTPTPIRINPEALAVGCGDPRQVVRAWHGISRRCAEAAAEIDAERSGRRQADRTRRLLEEVAELLPGHAALAAAVERSGELVWSLRAVAPSDHGGVPRFDPRDAEIAGDAEGDTDDGEQPEADDAPEPAQQPDPAERRPLEETWVLVPARTDAGTAPAARVGDPPTLTAHLDAVEEEATRIVGRLGLPAATATAVTLAARFHDLGKADPRLQAFFRRGMHAPWEEPIAKSVFGGNRAAARIAGRLAGLPRGLHHERGSVAVVTDALARDPGLLGDGIDPDLVRELISGHHGRACPVPAAPVGGAPPTPFEVTHRGLTGTASGGDDDGWEDGAALNRYFAVRQRYGAWTFAYLQALVVLADWAVSARGR